MTHDTNIDQFEIDSATYIQHAVQYGYEKAEDECQDMSPSHGWEAAFTDKLVHYFHHHSFHGQGKVLVERFSTHEEGKTGSDIRIEFHNAHKNQTFELFLQIKLERYDMTKDVHEGKNVAIDPTQVFDFKYRSKQNHQYQIIQMQHLAQKPGVAAAYLIFRPQRESKGHHGRPVAYLLPVESFQKGHSSGSHLVPLTDENVGDYTLEQFKKAFGSRIVMSAEEPQSWRHDAFAWYLYRTSESGKHH